MLPMYKIYIDYTSKYKQIYGDKTVVLLQIGGFYEIYSSGSDIVDIKTIADICNMVVTKKSKAINDVGPHNPYMTGFPIEAINKFLNLLVTNQYTCIVISQTGDDDMNRTKIREVTEIVSPSTYTTNNFISNNNYLCVLYFEQHNDLLYLGISGIDVNIGNTFVSETISTLNDNDKAIDELFRILSSYNPNEIIIISDKIIPNYKKIEDIVYSYSKSVHPKWNTYDFLKDLQKISYQTEILNKAFKHSSITNIFDVIHIDRKHLARISLCCAIQFAYEHNPNIITKLNYPFIVENDSQMIIEYDSVLQLNLISNNPNDKSLLHILNNCKTAFGKRSFKDTLLNPIIDIDLLNKKYEEINDILQLDFEDSLKFLSNIIDLQRFKRRIILKKIVPSDWCSFYTSLENIKDLYNFYNIDTKIIDTLFDSISCFDIDMCSKYSTLNDIKYNFFKIGIYPDIDELVNTYNDSFKKICDISKKITDFGDKDSTLSRVENNKDGFFISITKKRFDFAYSINKTYMSSFDKKFSNNTKTSYNIINDDISSLSDKMQKSLLSLNTLLIQHYFDFFYTYISENEETLSNIIQCITNIDINVCIASNSKKWNLVKPSISSYDHSFLDIKGIRNPIVECLDNDIEYVRNDISLDSQGMLLYGINSSGKSSLMKAVGLNIIMAQAGMYCFCDSINYHPYKHLFTRISGLDNIYRGMSSFVVEMTELRNILNRSDKYSLVLGDEICSGTENISAISIVASSLYQLTTNKSSFIFATHLHELIDIDIIKHLSLQNQISIKHMHISFQDGIIIYNRQIMDGNGSKIYGIEVCKTLNMPKDFLLMSENIRKEILHEDSCYVPLQTSLYNSSVYMDLCQVCKINKAVHTHHIKYQKEDTYDKNAKHNLIPLCEECHHKEHSDVFHIKGYTQTSDGKTIDYQSKTIDETNLQDLDYITLKKYIRLGKCNIWYIRSKESGKFKKIIDEKLLLKKFNQISNIHIYSITDNIKQTLFDLSM